jgi:hypothetical protein
MTIRRTLHLPEVREMYPAKTPSDASSEMLCAYSPRAWGGVQ